MKQNAYAVVMAGGKGTRFWPLSRAGRPKQLLKLLGAKSLVRETVDRVAPLFGRRNIFVVTVEEHQRAIRRDVKSIPKTNFLIEPEGKNTAPCIGLAALEAWGKDPGAVMVVLPADHWIDGKRRFARALGSAIDLAAAEGVIVTLGIRPSYPETGYGYILKGRRAAGARGTPAYAVRSFVEKPPRNEAAQLIRRGALWNSGIIIARAATILEAIRRYVPAVARPLARIEAMTVGKSLGDLPARLRRRLRREYRKMPSISIDYAVLEKAGSERKVTTLDAGFAWSDVGSWDALHRMLPKDRAGNAGPGRWLGFRSSNCLIYSPPDRLVALLGLENAVVVDTPDALLVADIKRSQEIKDLLDALARAGHRRFTLR